MGTQHLALHIHKLSARNLFVQAINAAAQEPPVIIIGYKTDFVTLRFLAQFIPAAFGRHLPHFRLGEYPQGHTSAVEAVLAQSPQHIRLVFLSIHCAGDVFAAFQFIDNAVMAGRDKFAIEHIGPAKKAVPLDMGVAEHTRVGGAACHVFVHKIINNVIAKFVANIHDKMVKTQLYGHLARVVDAIERATARFFFGTAGRGIVPGFHGYTYDFPAFLVQQHGSDRTIDSARHGD